MKTKATPSVEGRLPKISIITPTFNAEKTLERTIKSVLGQGIAELEYIIVDGLSKDGTLPIVQKHAGGVSRWVSERDKGIYDAMNKGVAMATGDWIGILNADDTYAEGVLDSLADLIGKHPEVEVFYADIRMVFENRPAYVLKSVDRLKTVQFWRMPVWHPTMFVRKDVYRKWGAFADTYRIASDYELVLRFYKSKVKFMHVEACWVEMAGGGASDVNWLEGKREMRQIAEKHGVFGGALKLFYRLDILKVRLSALLQSIPVLRALQAGYRNAKSRMEPGF